MDAAVAGPPTTLPANPPSHTPFNRRKRANSMTATSTNTTTPAGSSHLAQPPMSARPSAVVAICTVMAAPIAASKNDGRTTPRANFVREASA